MSKNTANVNKSEGAKTDNIKILGTDMKQPKEKNLICEGKYEAKTLQFGAKGNEYIVCKYEQNTIRDVEKREAKLKASEEGR